MTTDGVSITRHSGEAMASSSITGDNVPPRNQSGIDTSAKLLDLTTTYLFVNKYVGSNSNIIEDAKALCCICFSMVSWWSHDTSSCRQPPFSYLSCNLNHKQEPTPNYYIHAYRHSSQNASDLGLMLS
jgi:hypothetical protein